MSLVILRINERKKKIYSRYHEPSELFNVVQEKGKIGLEKIRMFPEYEIVTFFFRGLQAGKTKFKIIIKEEKGENINSI